MPLPVSSSSSGSTGSTLTLTLTPATPPDARYARYAPRLHVSVDEASHVALVVLNRPDKLNATDVELHRDLGRVWRDVDEDERVRVSVVTGNGRAFSAGGDADMLADLVKSEAVRRLVMKDARELFRAIVEAEKPVVAAVNGAAVGAGAVVALTSDVVIASENAKFGDGHTKLGVAAGDHAAAVWPLAMGMAKAKLLLLTGDMLSAKQAEALGLVSEVVPHDRVLARSLEIAEKLANGPAHAIRATKFALNQWLRGAALQAMDVSLAMEMMNFSEADAREGVAALKEKRPPKFNQKL